MTILRPGGCVRLPAILRLNRGQAGFIAIRGVCMMMADVAVQNITR